MPREIYVISRSTLTRLERALGCDQLTCTKCGEPILLGQLVHSSRGNNPRNRRIYHQRCWDSIRR